MAERKPVVMVGWQLQELPAGDTLPPQTPATHSHATSDVTGLDAALAGKEPTISAGTTAQYWRGDKAWRDFFTDVRAATLTGLSTATNAVIAATDTVLAALGKLQKQVSDNLTTLTNHTSNTSNPHGVTKAQVGLGNVDNTADSAKPVSTAQQTALDTKQDTLVSGTNIKTLNGASLLGSGNIAIEASVGDHAVRVTTGNGLGSTNTQIRRFTTTLESVGTAITYADSATNGASFTINEAGIYAVVYMDEGSSGNNAIHGVSLNSNQLTTAIYSIATTDRKTISCTTAGMFCAASAVFRAGVGDVVRAHVGPLDMETTSSQASFEIRKVAV